MSACFFGGALANSPAQQLPATSTLQDACNDFLNRFNFYCGTGRSKEHFFKKTGALDKSLRFRTETWRGYV